MDADQDIEAFVRDRLGSVWALELLLVLRADAARDWETGELVRELRASRRLVVDNLGRLERAGMAVRQDGGAWRYRSANEAIDILAGRLEAAFRERPVWVINAIASRPDALRSLSDAFDMRKDRT